MKKQILLSLIFTATILCAARAQDATGLYLNNRAPLMAKSYMEHPIGAVRPQGRRGDDRDPLSSAFVFHC